MESNHKTIKIMTIIWALLVGAVIFLPTGYYWGWISQQKATTPATPADVTTGASTATAAPTDTPASTATPVSTANWKTYTDTTTGFVFKYPSSIAIGSNVTSGLSMTVVAQPISSFNGPLGYDSAGLTADKVAIASGNLSLSPNGVGMKLLSIANATGKSFTILQQLEVCDVQFVRVAVIYKGSSAIVIKLTDHDASTIEQNNSSYFKTNSVNCGTAKVWSDSSSFYSALVAGKTDSTTQAWYQDFETILSTFAFTR